MKTITGGVTAPMGFEAAGAMAGIKYQNKKDMAMIYSTKPCVLAATFTSNVVKASPVLWDKKVVEESKYGQAVVVNAGIANACTGELGYNYCLKTAKTAAAELSIPEDAVLVASTGVIGKQLPIDRICEGVKKLAKLKKHTPEAGTEAAEAIMTTDTISKQAAAEIEVQGCKVTVGGMSKGSGMIHPNMCTMLGFLTTDAVISKPVLTKILKEDVVDTFNMISVDGDTSTNDTLVIMANGCAGNPEIKEGTKEYEAFREAVHYINETLAKKMAGDGEGATSLIEAKIVGADTKEHARTLGRSVISSSLTKAAIYGHDANWGRIMCALGYAGVTFDPMKVELWYESRAGKIQLCKDGIDCDYSEEEATRILSEDEVTIIADLHMGTAFATAWGCDLTYDYVKINADYRS